jgi:hypothetical protein
MKIANFLAAAFLGLGVTAALGIAFAPQIVRRLSSGPSVKGPGYSEGVAFAAVLLVAVCALVAVVASLLAWLAARRAGVSAGALWSCWLPVRLAGAAALWLWTRLPR